MKKIIFLSFISLIFLTGCTALNDGSGSSAKGEVLGIEEARVKATDFINNNLLEDGQKAVVKEIIEESGLYKIIINTGTSQDFESFMSKDGKTFFPQALDTEKIDTASVNGADQPATHKVVPINVENEYVKGNKDATVEVIEYSDFECPYCLQHTVAMHQLFNDYQDKIKIVFRHFPLSFHPKAQKAAEASECAGEQGKFWEMHKKIFEANEASNMSVAQWKQEAKNLGLNATQFNTCLDEGKYDDKVKEDQAGGQVAGVTGTPATFINGQMLSGAVGYDQLKQIIEAELAK